MNNMSKSSLLQIFAVFMMQIKQKHASNRFCFLIIWILKPGSYTLTLLWVCNYGIPNREGICIHILLWISLSTSDISSSPYLHLAWSSSLQLMGYWWGFKMWQKTRCGCRYLSFKGSYWPFALLGFSQKSPVPIFSLDVLKQFTWPDDCPVSLLLPFFLSSLSLPSYFPSFLLPSFIFPTPLPSSLYHFLLNFPFILFTSHKYLYKSLQYTRWKYRGLNISKDNSFIKVFAILIGSSSLALT